MGSQIDIVYVETISRGVVAPDCAFGISTAAGSLAVVVALPDRGRQSRDGDGFSFRMGQTFYNLDDISAHLQGEAAAGSDEFDAMRIDHLPAVRARNLFIRFVHDPAFIEHKLGLTTRIGERVHPILLRDGLGR